MNNRAWF